MKETWLTFIVDAAIVLRKKAISDRRQALARAEERDDAERSRAVQIDQAIHTAQYARRMFACLNLS